MKNVLFATTALVAFAGAAAAEIGFSGETTVGFNDETKGGLYWSGEVNANAVVDMGDSVTVTFDVTIGEWSQNFETNDAYWGNLSPTVEVAYTGDPINASLKYGDLNDAGASEYFYNDRSGMTTDVENHDGDDDVRALLEFGSFGLAVGCGDVTVGGGQNCENGLNVGAGATFGSISVGVGYDEGAGQDEVMAISADAAFGAMEVGVSYASNSATNVDSIGVEVAYALSDALTLGAYYAVNDGGVSDGYGVSVAYTAGALSADVFFDHTDDNNIDEFGANVYYSVTDMLTVNVGVKDGIASTLGGDVNDFHYYAGVDYMVNDNVTATIAYSTADEDLGDPEYMQGITAKITATF